MKLIALTVTTILLIGCSSSQPKPQKTMSPEDKLYLSMGIQKNPKEKNPLFYEIPGQWRAKGTDQDCENSWTRLTISEDKKYLKISQEASGKANTPQIYKSLPFKIKNATRTSLSLTEQSAAGEAWEIKMPTLTLIRNASAGGNIEIPMLTVFSLKSKNDPIFSIIYSRCIKNMQIKVSEPMIIEGLDLSEALEKAGQK